MLRYTPYDGSKQPFSIGLEPLDPARWIEPDEHLLAELALKDELIAAKRDIVFRERAETQDSQREIRDALVEHVLKNHSDRFARDGDAILIDGTRSVAVDGDAPLLVASRLVQDDLCIMRSEADGWRLVAASLCFPSSWSLMEKFDRAMDAIHAGVPGFNGRMGDRVARIFDHLRPGAPVWRLNWSIYDDGDLHHPETKSRPRRWSSADGSFGDQAFIRVERQTLAKMPASGDILFTIRVYADPVAAFRAHPNGRMLVEGLRTQLLGLDDQQARYKNLVADRERIAASLAALFPPS